MGGAGCGPYAAWMVLWGASLMPGSMPGLTRFQMRMLRSAGLMAAKAAAAGGSARGGAGGGGHAAGGPRSSGAPEASTQS
jgi:hypothetical protein